jgi:MYXO-CTERM domain-containing protein
MTTTTTTGSTGGLDDSGTSSGASGSSGASETAAVTSTTGFDTSEACPQIYAPVCGKDGETYDNACVAEGAGVEIRREGPCLGDCEGSCGVAPQGPSLLGLVLVVFAFVRPRRRGSPR